jgi:hypothetical protein
VLLQLPAGLEAFPMAVNPPRPAICPSPKVHAQVEELRELAKQFPEPILDDVLADWEWLHAQMGTLVIEPYFEQLVAVCDGRIVGSDPEDELALRIRLSKEYQLHPERFVISFLG